ncbi:hypothetical protein Ocin01_02163 [Orchesella cincta]|uniref:Uncharacterized protein n=1 Tax=Orchesella cincta TaxID=48709 RepID=A0A1D2NHV1_ORCCI|nr:hypothetical protein Ocin01_02163 [Orchesella cincta]
MGKSPDVTPKPTSTASSSTTTRLSILKKLHNSGDKSVPRNVTPGVDPDKDSKKDESSNSFAVPAVPSPKGGPGNLSGSGTGSNMRKLLDDLHQSRISIEQDQKAYQKARRGIKVIDKKLAGLKLEMKEGEAKWNKLVVTVAEKKTELSTVEIRNKIVEDSLKRGEQELSDTLEELARVRLESSKLASSFLSRSLKFAWLWNGTELGRKNRLHYDQHEMENLKREMRQLELELEEFLVLKKEVEECERSKKELEQEYKVHDEAISGREKELQEKIDELDMTLLDLQRQKDEMTRSSEDECEKLRRQIQESTKPGESKLTESKDNAAKSQVDIVDLCSDEFKINNEGEGRREENGTIAAGASCQKTYDTKHRVSRFQAPAVKVEPKSKSNTFNSSYGESFSNSNDEDVDICLAAAEAVSQTMRSYEPVTPIPPFTNQRPPPAKVRAIERQTPITSFMKQQSAARIFSSKNSSARGKLDLSRSSSSNSGKVFQFKKKTSSFSEKENMSTNDALNASSSSTSFLNQCELEPEPICAIEKTSDPSNQPLYTRNSRKDFYNNPYPYSSFNSSRILLSESQEQLL